MEPNDHPIIYSHVLKRNIYQITNKTHLYHATKPENLNSIMEHGLIRGGMKEGRGFAVYLSEQPDSWCALDQHLVVLKVDITGLYGYMTIVDPNLDDILIWKDIEPGRISILPNML